MGSCCISAIIKVNELSFIFLTTMLDYWFLQDDKFSMSSIFSFNISSMLDSMYDPSIILPSVSTINSVEIILMTIMFVYFFNPVITIYDGLSLNLVNIPC